MSGGIFGQGAIVVFGGQRIVEYFIESGACELLGYKAAQCVVGIARSLEREAGVEFVAKFYVVVALDAQNVFDDVARAAYVVAVGGHLKVEQS